MDARTHTGHAADNAQPADQNNERMASLKAEAAQARAEAAAERSDRFRALAAKNPEAAAHVKRTHEQKATELLRVLRDGKGELRRDTLLIDADGQFREPWDEAARSFTRELYHDENVKNLDCIPEMVAKKLQSRYATFAEAVRDQQAKDARSFISNGADAPATRVGR